MSIACASGFSLYIAWIAVISDVRANGDEAVRRYSQRLDGWSPKSFRLSPDEVRDIVSSVPETVLEDLRFAQHQVRRFAQAQRESLREFEIETLPGVYLGHRHVPIQASGAYAPGGRYPLTASAHMIVLTAKVAGVERVAAATPPNEGLPPRISVAAMHLGGPMRSTSWVAFRPSPPWRWAPRPSIPCTSSPDPATPTWPRRNGNCSARSASTCSPGPPRR